MKVYLERTNEYKEAKAANVKELLERLKLNPTAVLVVKNGTLVTPEARLEEKDEVKILSVISGG